MPIYTSVYIHIGDALIREEDVRLHVCVCVCVCVFVCIHIYMYTYRRRMST